MKRVDCEVIRSGGGRDMLTLALKGHRSTLKIKLFDEGFALDDHVSVVSTDDLDKLVAAVAEYRALVEGGK